MGLSEEQEKAIQGWGQRNPPAPQSSFPAYIRPDLGDQRHRPTATSAPTPASTSSTAHGGPLGSRRSLYLTILSALLGFNIFESLFGRESNGSGDECGSWFFPVLDEPGAPIGFFTSGADRMCPRMISGSLTEAVVSAIALAAVAATIYFTSDSR